MNSPLCLQNTLRALFMQDYSRTNERPFTSVKCQKKRLFAKIINAKPQGRKRVGFFLNPCAFLLKIPDCSRTMRLGCYSYATHMTSFFTPHCQSQVARVAPWLSELMAIRVRQRRLYRRVKGRNILKTGSSSTSVMVMVKALLKVPPLPSSVRMQML